MKNFFLFFTFFGIAILLSHCNGEREGRELSSELSKNTGTARTEDSKRFVRKCLRNLRGPENVQVDSYSTQDLPYTWVTQPYTLTARENTILLKMTLGIDYQTSSQSTPEIQNRMKGIRSCMIDFFKRHSIDLEIDFPAMSNGNAPVTFLDNADPKTNYDLYNWSFHMNDYELVSPIDCTIVTHEVGHILGLKDEYADEFVPDRVIGEENSLMHSSYVAPNHLKLYPRHLQTFLSPLCSTLAE